MAQPRKPTKSGQDTKDRILDAALETVRTQGLVGTSARVIAKTGDFNQALVFYHFGSIEGLLLAALQRAHSRRMDLFAADLEAVSDLAGLVKIGQSLHASSGDIDQPALSAIVAGWPSSSDVGKTVLETLQPWNDLVSEALKRILGSGPIANVVPTADLAYAIAALFLGIEMLSQLDTASDQADRIFQMFTSLSGISGQFLNLMNNQQ